MHIQSNISATITLSECPSSRATWYQTPRYIGTIWVGRKSEQRFRWIFTQSALSGFITWSFSGSRKEEKWMKSESFPMFFWRWKYRRCLLSGLRLLLISIFVVVIRNYYIVKTRSLSYSSSIRQRRTLLLVVVYSLLVLLCKQEDK